MAEELSYVLVTPYSIRKSRTGGIVARLISRTGLDLVAARMYAPSSELVEKYAASIVTETEPRYRATQELIRKYVLKNFAPSESGTRPRVMLLVFKGEDAVMKIRSTVGHIVNERTSGETIRDTYGDYMADASGNVTYFEPAVLAPPDTASAEANLKLWTAYSDSDGGLLDGTVDFPTGTKVEKTLVLIKPDNFRFPNARPGGVIDLFSRTGLYIIAFKVHRMSVAQAEEFYGPVLEVLMDKLKDRSASLAKPLLEKEFNVTLNDESMHKLGELLGPINGRENWEQIVKFMAGLKPSDCPADKRNEPGSEKCIAICYQGVEAVRKIREVLGPTDPSKAPPGSIRREFGQTIMVNAAHASDSAENAQREMGIINITENNLKPLVEGWYTK
ncbi:MAG: nucleoside diphosphate kinase [Chthoniobacteraceae bacterium]|nr:nucleoside diphosphate kinase [Chthoniobacteraceae bacterium]